MSNQQERLETVIDRAWIAGCMECDGSFSLHKNKNKVQKGTQYFQIQPSMTFVNTDRELVKQFKEALNRLDIPHNLCVRDQLGIGTKPIYQFQISGLKRSNRVLPLIMPYLRGIKRKKAELMYKFTKYRLSVTPNVKYGETEEKIFNDFYSLAQESSETICQTPESEDIVRTA
jgi:hypothetical protein